MRNTNFGYEMRNTFNRGVENSIHQYRCLTLLSVLMFKQQISPYIENFVHTIPEPTIRIRRLLISGLNIIWSHKDEEEGQKILPAKPWWCSTHRLCYKRKRVCANVWCREYWAVWLSCVLRTRAKAKSQYKRRAGLAVSTIGFARKTHPMVPGEQKC